MQTAKVDNKGTIVSYIDSGPVEGDTYTTIVIVHGHTYHAETFRKLFPIAARRNLRLVAFNRRGYRGTSPFTDEDLTLLNSHDAEKHKVYLADRGLDIAIFISWFIDNHQLPKPTVDGTSGGIALLAWSAGNIPTLAFLKYGPSYPSDLIAKLNAYVRTIVLYELAFSAHGYAWPEGSYHPLVDEAIPINLRPAAFSKWVSSYYAHPDLPSRKITGLDVRIPESPHRLSTMDTITTEELVSITDPAAGNRTENQYYNNVARETMYEQMCGALFDPETAPKFLPDATVEVIYCKETNWSIHWGVWELEKDIKKYQEAHMETRSITVKMSEVGNHFYHWDDPEECLDFFYDSTHPLSRK